MVPRFRSLASGLAAAALSAAAARAGLGEPCESLRDPDAVRAVVVTAGEEDPRTLAQIAALGANMIVTVTEPRASTGAAASAAGLGYLPQVSTQDVERLVTDAAWRDHLRAVPGLTGFHYLDEGVLEGYASPATQARTYGILKAFFPWAMVIYATRLDPVATDPGFLDAYFRPEYTDFVAPYFYPVGNTVLGPQGSDDPWEARLEALLEPLAARTPSGKPVLPVIQTFEQTGFPVTPSLPERQLVVYRRIWPAQRGSRRSGGAGRSTGS